MQATTAFIQETGVLSVNAMQAARQILSATGMEYVHVRTAPLVQNVTSVMKTFLISHLRDASKYW